MSLFSWLFDIVSEDQARKCRVVRIRNSHGQNIPVVSRGTRELWQEKGWQLRNGTLHGSYRTARKTFRGKIENPFSSNPEFFICNPSKAILKGRHGPCFRERGEKLYWVHFSPVPDDVNAGILRIEHCMISDGL